MTSPLCPVCGASDRRHCEINEMAGAADGEIECMREEVDPDILREDRDELNRAREEARNG